MNLRFVAIALLMPGAGAGSQQLPPIRPIGATVAVSREPLGNVNTVRQLANGNLLVNDLGGRRVLMLDPSLAFAAVVADSTAATGNAYSGRIAGLVPYRGDSTLFVDPQSLSMLMIHPDGKLGRTMSVPRAEDAFGLAGFQGLPGLDPQGRLIYRGALTFGRVHRGEGGPMMPVPPDSLPIVRVDLGTRKLDTMAFVRVPKIRMNVTRDANGGVRMQSEINPLPLVDEWAVTSDGALALIRGQDYHVDWVLPDGSRRSAPKMPFEWQRLTDEDKVAFIDSVRAMRERMAAAGGPAARGGTGMVVLSGGGGEVRQTVVAGAGNAAAGSGAPGAARDSLRALPQFTFVPPGDLPDYKPPFFSGSTRADRDGNVWILTIPTRARPGGVVYDVVNGKGELVDRVQLPVNRTVVGFGPGGVVYMIARESHGSATLEKANAR